VERAAWADGRKKNVVGKVAVYDPKGGRWREWRLPGERSPALRRLRGRSRPRLLTDFGANAVVHFDPVRERFETFRLRSPGASVRQLLGRPGELWGAESGADRLVVARSR
jgi:virginiamycin B lyase